MANIASDANASAGSIVSKVAFGVCVAYVAEGAISSGAVAGGL
jgi:hypothetical protein